MISNILDSVNVNDLTVNNGPTSYVTGRVGNGLRFSSNLRLNAPGFDSWAFYFAHVSVLLMHFFEVPGPLFVVLLLLLLLFLLLQKIKVGFLVCL